MRARRTGLAPADKARRSHGQPRRQDSRPRSGGGPECNLCFRTCAPLRWHESSRPASRTSCASPSRNSRQPPACRVTPSRRQRELTAPATQGRLRDVHRDHRRRVLPWAGSVPHAFAWYRAQPLPSFGDQTAEDLVKAGRAEAVKAYRRAASRSAATREADRTGLPGAPSTLGLRSPLRGGSRRCTGGRFNPKGKPALYTSRRIETAWLEAQQGFAFKAQPMTLCALRRRLLGCRRPRRMPPSSPRLGIDAADLSCRLGEISSPGGQVPLDLAAGGRAALSAEGAAGAVVPSFAPGAARPDVNVVFSRAGSRCVRRTGSAVVDPFGRLPRDDRYGDKA